MTHKSSKRRSESKDITNLKVIYMRRVITLAILIFVCFLLQSTLFGMHDLDGITPNLMLILTMSFGLMRGRKEGMLTGFFCGFLTDCFFMQIMGPFMFLYMIIGYMNGFFHKNYMVEDVMLPLFVVIADEFIFNMSIYVFSFMLMNRLDLKGYFFGIILPETLYTAIITVVLYKIFVFINKHLKEKNKEKKNA